MVCYINFNITGKTGGLDPWTTKWQRHNEQVEWQWKTNTDAVEPVSPWGFCQSKEKVCGTDLLASVVTFF